MNPLYQWLGGAVLALVLGGCGLMLDGPTDWQAEEDTAAAVREAALHEALARQQAAHPERWTAEQRARGGVAAGLVARGATK